MKWLRLFWDFLFGVLLIGGAPWAVLALTVILGDLYQSLFHVIISDITQSVIVSVMMIAATAMFCFAVSYRFRRRLIPKWLVVLEIMFGLAGAIFFFGLYGVVSYAAYGN